MSAAEGKGDWAEKNLFIYLRATVLCCSKSDEEEG